MPENIFEHTISIAGLTCEPLSILSETISPREMSTVQGGNDGSGGVSSSQTGQVSQTEIDSWRSNAEQMMEELTPKGPDILEGDYYPDLSSSIGGEGINPLGDAFEWCVNQVSEDLEDAWEDLEDAWEDLEDAWEDLEDAWDWLTDEEEEDEGNNDEGSGLPDEENSTEGNNG